MQKVTPCLWFDHNAEEAVEFYQSVFKDFQILSTMRYPTEGLADFQKEFAGQALTIDFEMNGQRFVALNAGSEFTFNESISFMISCKDQAEIDYYWNALTADGGEESVCGWLKDKFGLSWQVIPADMPDYMNNSDSFKNMMAMKKIIIADL